MPKTSLALSPVIVLVLLLSSVFCSTRNDFNHVNPRTILSTRLRPSGHLKDAPNNTTSNVFDTPSPECYQQNDLGLILKDCKINKSKHGCSKFPVSTNKSSFVKVFLNYNRIDSLGSSIDSLVNGPPFFIDVCVIFLRQITSAVTVKILFNQFETLPESSNISTLTKSLHYELNNSTTPCWTVDFTSVKGWTRHLLRINGVPVNSNKFSIHVTDSVRGTAIISPFSSTISLSSINAANNQFSQLDFRELLNQNSSDSDWSTLFPERSDDGQSTFSPENRSFKDYKDLQAKNNPPSFQNQIQHPYNERNDWPEQQLANGHKPFAFGRPRRFACNCPVPTELTQQHSYEAVTATFTLNVTTSVCSDACCLYCKVKVEILKYRKAHDAASCSKVDFSPSVMDKLYQVSKTDSLIPNTPYKVKLSEGCYTAKLELQPNQWFHGFFWVQPETTLPDLNTWNTTFFLEPKPLRREVEVRWSEPMYPYNFSHYSLQLWYQADTALNCTGHSNDEGKLLQVEPTPSLPLNKSRGVFTDMSPGWYCARVTPMDPRCPPDGCAVRTSHSVLLLPSDISPDLSDATTFSPSLSRPRKILIIFGVCMVVVCSMLLIFVYTMVRRRRNIRESSHRSDTGTASKVPLLNGTTGGTGQKSTILVVWTALMDQSGGVRSAVTCLKRILACHFKLWDYLELTSLEAHQRELLLQNPAGWLYSTLTKTETKVVLVSTEGAGVWQKAIQDGATPVSGLDSLEPLDRTLFPYLLQLVLHDTNLVANYSRVFVVRLGKEEGEGLQGISQGLVYRLPLHLQALLKSVSGTSRSDSAESPSIPLPLAESDLVEFSRCCDLIANDTSNKNGSLR